MDILVIVIFTVVIAIANLYGQRAVKTYYGMFKRAALIAAALTALFQLSNYFIVGYIDAFVTVAVVAQFLFSVLVGSVVGLIKLKIETKGI